MESGIDCLDFLSHTLEPLIVRKSWWDTVDLLASNVVGALLRTHTAPVLGEMDAWIQSDNMWKRRTAIICQLHSKTCTDTTRLQQFVLARAHEEEFFIRKVRGKKKKKYTEKK